MHVQIVPLTFQFTNRHGTLAISSSYFLHFQAQTKSFTTLIIIGAWTKGSTGWFATELTLTSLTAALCECFSDIILFSINSALNGYKETNDNLSKSEGRLK